MFNTIASLQLAWKYLRHIRGIELEKCVFHGIWVVNSEGKCKKEQLENCVKIIGDYMKIVKQGVSEEWALTKLVHATRVSNLEC